jgi:hypothetical protein
VRGEHGGGEMPSENDRRVLRDMQVHLCREHPALGRFTLSTIKSPPRLGRAAQDIVTLTAGLLALVCLGFLLAGAPTTGPGLLAAVVSMASYRARRRHFPPRWPIEQDPGRWGRAPCNPLPARSTH